MAFDGVSPLCRSTDETDVDVGVCGMCSHHLIAAFTSFSWIKPMKKPAPGVRCVLQGTKVDKTWIRVDATIVNEPVKRRPGRPRKNQPAQALPLKNSSSNHANGEAGQLGGLLPFPEKILFDSEEEDSDDTAGDVEEGAEDSDSSFEREVEAVEEEALTGPKGRKRRENTDNTVRWYLELVGKGRLLRAEEEVMTTNCRIYSRALCFSAPRSSSSLGLASGRLSSLQLCSWLSNLWTRRRGTRQASRAAIGNK